jgi:hypothetical protein
LISFDAPDSGTRRARYRAIYGVRRREAITHRKSVIETDFPPFPFIGLQRQKSKRRRDAGAASCGKIDNRYSALRRIRLCI